MPTAIHEIFLAQVEYDIESQLEAIGNNIDVARNIGCDRSTDIKLGNSKHSPDSAFAYHGSRYPHVVIEVSYSQKQKDLPYLADAYIVESDEKIGVVIGLDIGYKETKKATLSVWRPRDVLEGEEIYLESQCTVSEVSGRNCTIH